MVVIDLANEMEWLSSSSDMDEKNSTMSNFIKRDLVFHHQLTLMVFATFVMISSRCFLLTSPNAFFEGLISQYWMLFLKFGLWSLMVKKVGRLA